MGEHGLIDKRVMYEESIRVPCFVYCPALIQKPVVKSEFILNIDIAPTILDMANIEIPGPMHGKSFLPLAMNHKTNWRKEFVYEYFIDPNAPQTPTIFGLRTEKFSYMTYHGVWDIYELYNMEKDPDQLNNLLGSIVYGYDYGTFLKHVERQEPELYPLVSGLDQQLTDLLHKTQGKRQPSWKD